MKKCDIFLLILSKNALDRCNNPNDPVRQEIIVADSYHLAFIPVLSEDFVWPEKMPDGMEEFLDLNAIRYVQTYSNEFFDKLYKFIDQVRNSKDKKPSNADTDGAVKNFERKDSVPADNNLKRKTGKDLSQKGPGVKLSWGAPPSGRRIST